MATALTPTSIDRWKHAVLLLHLLVLLLLLAAGVRWLHRRTAIRVSGAVLVHLLAFVIDALHSLMVGINNEDVIKVVLIVILMDLSTGLVGGGVAEAARLARRVRI